MKSIVVTALVTLSMSLTLASPAYANHPMCGKTELADIMGNMKDNMKAVKKAVKTGDIAQVTSIANELLSQADEAQNYVPLAISDQTTLTAEQQAQVTDYKEGINTLKQAVSALAKATTMDDVKSALEDIGAASKKGHKAFKMDCDE